MSTKKLDVKGTTSAVLTGIRKHTPEEQNKIIDTVLKEIIIKRSTRAFTLRKESTTANIELEQLVSISPSFEVQVKELFSKLEDRK